MTRCDIILRGDGYTEAQAETIKAEALAYAAANGLKGEVIITEPLI